MRRNTVITLSLIVVVVAVAVAVFLLSGEPTQDAPSTEATASGGQPLEAEYVWPAGLNLLYKVEITQKSSIQAGAGSETMALGGELAFSGQMRLTALETRGDVTTFELTWPRIDALRWVILEKTLPEAEASAIFTNNVALLELYSDGQVRSLRFLPSAPRPYVHMMETWMHHLQAVIRRGEPQWTLGYADGFLDGDAHHLTKSCDDEACDVAVTRASEDLEALRFIPEGFVFDTHTADTDASFKLLREGHLKHFQTRTSVSLTRDDAKIAQVGFNGALTLLSATNVDVQDRLASLQTFIEGRALTDVDPRQEALRQRAGNMTFGRARGDLLAYGAGGLMPDHKKWMWQLTGLLLLQPELAGEFADLFLERSELASPAKALILEILASTGNHESQAAMRRILGDAQVAKHEKYAALVQRFVLVARPEPETADFLAKTYTESEGPTRYGAANALGSAISRLQHEDPELARRHSDSLAHDLKQAKDSTATRAFVGAVANTRMPEQHEVLVPYTNSKDPKVRAEAADALAQIPAPEAVDALIQIVGAEADQRVQRFAIRSLSHHTLTTAQLEALRGAVQAGPIGAQNATVLIQTCMALAKKGAPVEDVLLALDEKGLPGRVNHQLAAALRSL